jgi:hypothetical protein
MIENALKRPSPLAILRRGLSATDTQAEQDAKRGAIEPPAEMWMDFSRLTMAFENGQIRTLFAIPGYSALFPTQLIANTSSNLFKAAGIRRTRLKNLVPLPKVLSPAFPASKHPGIKSRISNQNRNHLPVHLWSQFQFYKTMITIPRGT